MTKKLILIACSLFVAQISQAQGDKTAKTLPANVQLKDLTGKAVGSEELGKSGKITVVSFWATWCIPCINELSTINDKLEDWRKKTPFEFYAIAEDDSRTIKRVQPLVNGKNWDFTVLLDKNQDLKRELNLMNIPYTIIVKNGKIIYRHAGYVIGDEEELYKIIKQNQ